MRRVDAVVIGLGAMGSAAAWHLARRGVQVVGLEQFAPVHDRGSSHGVTRICRRAYFEHPDYVPLANAAYRGWDQLAALAGRELFVRSGLLLAGEPDGTVIQGVLRARDEHRLEIDVLPVDTARRRFAQFVIPDALTVLFERDSGYLLTEACVETLIRQAEAAGAELRFAQRVGQWRADGDGVRVETAEEVFLADRLVIAAGPWAARVAPRVMPRLRVLRKPQVWFGCDDARYAPQAGCPVFAYHERGAFLYGFPAVEPGVVKLAQHSSGSEVSSPDALRRDVTEDDLAPLRDFAGRCLRGVAADDVRRSSVCMYTMTPDEHFIVDRHPAHWQVILAAGFSGHGFKFAPVIGEAAARLAVEGDLRDELRFLQLARFSDRP